MFFKSVKVTTSKDHIRLDKAASQCMIPIRRARPYFRTNKWVILYNSARHIIQYMSELSAKSTPNPSTFIFLLLLLPSKAPFDPDECFKRNLRGFRVAQVRGDRVDGQDRGNWYRELTAKALHKQKDAKEHYKDFFPTIDFESLWFSMFFWGNVVSFPCLFGGLGQCALGRWC